MPGWHAQSVSSDVLTFPHSAYYAEHECLPILPE